MLVFIGIYSVFRGSVDHGGGGVHIYIYISKLHQELEKLTEGIDFLIFPAELNAAERKHAHEAWRFRASRLGIAYHYSITSMYSYHFRDITITITIVIIITTIIVAFVLLLSLRFLLLWSRAAEQNLASALRGKPDGP